MIKITESTLKKVISEAIQNVLSEEVDWEKVKENRYNGFVEKVEYYSWIVSEGNTLSDKQREDLQNAVEMLYSFGETGEQWAEIGEDILKQCSGKESLNEGQQYIDNFDMVANLLDVPTPDNFHFVQITKRFKDNPDDDRSNGNYHGGSWYIKGYRIHNAQELMALKPEIISICDKENARAYITINNRSEKETDSFIKIYRKKFRPSDARYKYADQIIPGQAKDGPNWRGVRKRVLVDIDVPKTAKSRNGETIWDEAKKMIKMVGITPIAEYETPSGGLHIVLPDKEDANFIYLKKLFEKFDNWMNKGRMATVHPNVDAKIILYSNVKTKGY